MKLELLAIAVAIAAALPAVGATSPAWGSPELLDYSHVHRGGGAFEAPDNTLETFLWCWEHGSALECD